MSETAPRKPMLEVNGLEYAYPVTPASVNGDFRLGPLSFGVYGGEFLAVIGPNGSGKSTLLRLLTGQAAPLRGSVHFDGAEVSGLDPRRRARRIAVVRQQAPLVFPMTVEDFILLGRYPYRDRFGFDTEEDRNAVRAAMEATQTCSLAARRTDEISGGELQRVVLARALAQAPELLLLDEPTANLDLSFQVELLRMVRRLVAERGLGVVAVMHEVNLASEFADFMLLLSKGRLCRFGNPCEVLTARALEEVYRLPVRVDWNPASGRPHVTVLATSEL